MIAGTETNEFPESLEQSDLALIQREIRRSPGQNRPFAERRPNGRFLIRKRPLREAPANGRFWPKAAVALKPSRMSELGQLRTLATYRCHVCFQG